MLFVILFLITISSCATVKRLQQNAIPKTYKLFTYDQEEFLNREYLNRPSACYGDADMIPNCDRWRL